jgi:hypothetical protein
MDGDSGACGVAMRGGVEGQWLLCTRQVCCFGGGFHHGAMVVSLAGVLVWSTELVVCCPAALGVVSCLVYCKIAEPQMLYHFVLLQKPIKEI